MFYGCKTFNMRWATTDNFSARAISQVGALWNNSVQKKRAKVHSWAMNHSVPFLLFEWPTGKKERKKNGSFVCMWHSAAQFCTARVISTPLFPALGCVQIMFLCELRTDRIENWKRERLFRIMHAGKNIFRGVIETILSVRHLYFLRSLPPKLYARETKKRSLKYYGRR